MVTWKLKNAGIVMSLIFALAVSGCSSQALNANNPEVRADAFGIGTGILLGAAGGALVGAALTGAPGLGAGVGALIGAGAGWAVANEAQKTQAQLAYTQAQLKQQQLEIEENRRSIDNAHDQAARQSGGQPASRSSASRTYVVRRGDTLSSIAKGHYGDANQYTKIFEANRSMLANPNKIYPGQSLRIPPEA